MTNRQSIGRSTDVSARRTSQGGYTITFDRALEVIGAVLGIVLLSTGCENSINPYAGEAVPYTVYGALSFKKEVHHVRVKPMQTPVHAVEESRLPVTVRLKNLDNGETWQLKDSPLTFGDQTVAHNFRTALDVEPRTPYELTVDGPDGRRTRATTITPTNTEALIRPSGHTPGAPSDTVDAGSGKLHCRTIFTVVFREAKVPYKSSIGLEVNGEYFWVPVSFAIRPLPDGNDGYRFIPENILRYINVESRNEPFPCRYYQPRCQVMTSGRLQIAYAYVGPEWFGNRPSVQFDRGFDPTSSTQIDNGIGFFGSYFRDTLSVTVHRGVIDLGQEACRPGF